jgi:hypothetical protein
MVRNIAPYNILFITQPPKPDSLVSQRVKPVLSTLPAHLASEEGKKQKQATRHRMGNKLPILPIIFFHPY